jgi:hypothetical protein
LEAHHPGRIAVGERRVKAWYTEPVILVQRLRDGARSALAALRRRNVLLVVAACALVGAMYCTNSDWGGDPITPRGDGQYRPVLARGDGHLYYLMARSTVIDGDWVFDNDLARFGDPWAARVTRAGRKAIPHPIGPALVWAPVLAGAQAMAWTLDQLGADIPLHGYTGFHQRLVFATTVLFAWLVVLFGYRAARRLAGGRWGPAFAAVAVLLGTSVAYYATYMPSYPHVMDACFAAAFLHYWVTTVGVFTVRRFAILGGLLGIATLVRSQELACGVVVAIEIGAGVVTAVRARAWRDAARMIGLGALTLAIALACFAFQIYEWHVVYGGWGGLPQGPRFTRFGHPLVLETLFSSRNGWFASTPIAYLGAIGLAFLPRRHRLIGAGLLAVVVVQVYLCSTVFDWWSSASFGQRRLVSMSYPLIVGLATLLVACAKLAARVRLRRWVRHAIALIVLGWLVAWNLVQVFPLRGGKPANADVHPMCCDAIPPPLRWIAQPVYRAIGNPFALPASAYFAVRYGVPLTRWDRAVGAYPLVPGLDDLTDGTYLAKARGAWNLGGGAGIEAWLVDGFGPSAPAAAGAPVGNLRWTVEDRARALVPSLMPEGQRMTLWVLAGARHVVLRWNGDVIADQDLADGWNPVRFDVPEDRMRTGMNTLDVEAPRGGDGRGVGVGRLELQFVPPSP